MRTTEQSLSLLIRSGNYESERKGMGPFYWLKARMYKQLASSLATFWAHMITDYGIDSKHTNSFPPVTLTE